MKSGVASLLAFMLLACFVPAHAEWPEDGSPACPAPYTQLSPKIVSDGFGGAFITWSDWPPEANGPYHHMQKADASGVLWPGCGTITCSVNGHGFYPDIIADGAGGAITVWVDSRGLGTPLYGQRIDANGAVVWAAEGVPVCGPEGYKWSPYSCSDGSGGAIIVWPDNRTGDYNVYAQRIDASGVLKWTENGVSICAASGDQGTARPVPDGSGGAIIVWSDERGGHSDIYAQRIDANGIVQWPVDGIPVCSADQGQAMLSIASDGAGGAIAAWMDFRSGNNDIYAQRVNVGGTMEWIVNGVALCTAAEDQISPVIASDGLGGAFVAWMDRRDTYHNFIYAQRVSASGAAQWASNGISICASIPSPLTLDIASDGLGGAVVAWDDYRNVARDIFAQRIDAGGMVLWGADGLPVCTAAGDQKEVAVAGDNAGGAFVAWRDKRSGTDKVFVKYVKGEALPLPVSFDIRPASCPNPLNPKSVGVLPTAILGTSDFDVYDIDPATITLEGVTPLRWSYEDAAAPAADGSACACTDAGPDGYIDLAIKFDMAALVEKLGEVRPGQTLALSASGTLDDGTPIEGSDCVHFVGEGPRKDQGGRTKLEIAVKSPSDASIQRIEYTLSEQALVDISLYDIAGRLVKRLDRRMAQAGLYTHDWNTAGLASGVYFCRISAGAQSLTRKIVLVK